MTFFSIVVPTYNRASFIVDTINTILNQTYKDFELIIVDDGSTDNTQELIEKEYASDERVKYFWKENEERGVARNYGFKKAIGQYVFFIDSDDYMRPNHLETLHAVIIKRPEINFWTTKFVLDNNGKIIDLPILHLKEGFYDYKEMIKGAHFSTLFCVKRDNPNLILFSEDRAITPLEDWVFAVQNTISDKIYLVDEITITMNEHAERSMGIANLQKVINVRLKATQFLIDNINFSALEKKIIQAYSHYFCAVHSYISGQRKLALNHIFKSIKLLGIKPAFIAIVIKANLGKKNMERIGKMIGR